MKKISILLAAATTVGLISLAAFAETADVKRCEPSETRQHIRDHFREKDDDAQFQFKHKQRNFLPFAELNLTDDQKKTLAAAREAQEPSIRELHEKLGAARAALFEAGNNNSDDALLNQLSNNLASLVAQQELAHIKMHKQLLAILTPEQKQKLDALKAERKDAPRWEHKLKDKKSASNQSASSKAAAK